MAISTRNKTPYIVRVDVTEDEDGLHVTPVWSGVDRPDSFGWRLRTGEHKLASRLVRAILAGVVFDNPDIAVDTSGKTYVTWDRCHVIGKYMNANLRQLGF